MKYRFINKNEIRSYKHKQEFGGNFVIYDNRVYTDPEKNANLPTTLEELGYKDLIEDPKPAYNEETQYIVPYYVDKLSHIAKKWDIIDIPTQEKE